MEELFKRIEQDVYRMGNEGAIHLARYHLDFNSLRGDSISINLIVSENMDEVIQVLNT